MCALTFRDQCPFRLIKHPIPFEAFQTGPLGRSSCGVDCGAVSPRTSGGFLRKKQPLCCSTHSHQTLVFHSQPSDFAVPLTAIRRCWSTQSPQTLLFHSQPSDVAVPFTAIRLCCSIHSHQTLLFHSQPSDTLAMDWRRLD